MINSTPLRFVAVALSVGAGALAIAGGEAVGHWIYPPPKNLDPNDLVATGAYAARAPKSVFIAVLVSYLVGSLIASYLATRFAGRASGRIAGQILAGLAVINVMTLPHPLWFLVGMGVAFFVGITGGPALHRPDPPNVA